MIEKNRLLDFDGVIYQNSEWFKFSLDSVLLVNFIDYSKKIDNIMDFCCGNAPIPMLLSYKTSAKIFGVELQKCIFDLGVKSIYENKMDDKISLINDDIKNISNYFKPESFDLITCNPPYFKYKTSSIISSSDIKSVARHEICMNLDDLIASVKYLLKGNGSFYMVHRTERFYEIINKLAINKLEPKRVQFIYSNINKNSDLFLIECKKNGRSGLNVLKPLIVFDDKGNYNCYIRDMYSDKR